METCEMATDDSVPKPGNGSKTGSDRRRSRAFNSPKAQTGATERPQGEFSKLRHYVRQMRGFLLDTQA
jgi:hypothetical protein